MILIVGAINYNMRTITVTLSLLVLAAFSYAAPKKEVYIPMDFSTCGYHASEKAIPHVPAVYTIPVSNPEYIQQAIDKLALEKPDKQGFRGAILLQAGEYHITEPLRISASGIVIRGAGKSATKIVKEGVDRGAAIYIEGGSSVLSNETLYVSDQKVKAGSTTLSLSSTANLKVGDRIAISRPSTKEWIQSIKMNDFGGGLDYTGWKAGDIDVVWHRTITNISGNQITLDSPITTTLDTQWAKTFVQIITSSDAISECGVENLTIESAPDAGDNTLTGEDHCWDGVWIENASDCWVRAVDFNGLAGSAVNLQRNTQRITVEDCIADNPLSEVGGWRRCVFTTRGEQNLFQRCISRHGIHDFSTGFIAAGPNAFVQCEGEESLGFSGSVGAWANGVLFDIVNIEGNDLAFKNLEQFRTGTGFNAANSMFWQCTASTIWCYSPDEDNKNSGHGCWATLTGNGEWTSSNDHVSPRSLFYAQLKERCPESTVNPYILERNTNASSSPTVEQAAELAQESLTTPRLTLEAWLDSVAEKNTLESASAQDATASVFSPAKNKKAAKSKSGAMSKSNKVTVSEASTSDLSLLKPLGKEYSITWWNGRTKDSNRFKTTTKFSPTRFVPGREGYGWTDRIDSLIDYLAAHDYQALYHNYGLWYDIRRTDHERVRRADGSVEAPFYEQPFARSGQGKAWDGLSRYDLTKPNLWYWDRLRTFAEKALPKGIFLYNCHYFQHNILEAGAHWVDCPWRPVNNINYEAATVPGAFASAQKSSASLLSSDGASASSSTASSLPEPVPFTGDKRIFIAEQFYDISNPVMAKYHRNYIRMCLDQTKENPNIVQFLSEEYTGPEHFMRFWLKTIKEWQEETGRDAVVALSCTKDVQDAILNDAELSKVVDIIDIRYWHYNTKECWAPKGGQNLAPRQHMRKWQKGKVGKEQVEKAITEYQQRYPDKVIIYSAEGK